MTFFNSLFGSKYRSQRSTISRGVEAATGAQGLEQPEGPDLWCEADRTRYPQWLHDIVKYNNRHHNTIHPAVVKLSNLIEGNPRIKLLACGMCDEAASVVDESSGSQRVKAIRQYSDLLRILNYMLKVPPLWNTHMFMLSLEAAPFYMLLRTIMHTTCGFAFFQDLQVNSIMKEIIDSWGTFLASSESASCLNTSSTGWFGPAALTHLVTEADTNDSFHTFSDIYICDPTQPHHGFTSWDSFFTRQFHPHIRPLASPTDDSIITNVCEAQPWRIAHNVQWQDHFWAKGGHYSLREMLACDDLSTQFIGGTIYQAYLSALAYHRWHSPVTGTIVKATKVPGYYFSEPSGKGFGGSSSDVNESDPNWQQCYLSAVATRAVIFIEADNPEIGLVAVIFIGMSEVSTCELTVMEGQRVMKGQQLGMFHFGGSTHCVLFRAGVELVGLPDPKSATRNLPVRSRLASVRSRRRECVEYKEKDASSVRCVEAPLWDEKVSTSC